MESPEKDPGKIAQANKSSVISGILSQGHQNQASTSVRKAFNSFCNEQFLLRKGKGCPKLVSEDVVWDWGERDNFSCLGKDSSLPEDTGC